jgi:hypothetical protein
MTTDPTGAKDLPDSPFTRIYFMSSMQHGTGNGAARGVCQQFQNPLDSQAVQRALFIALDKWVTNGTQPPASQVPKLSDGTLVKPEQTSTGFPHIPGVTYSGFKTTRYLLNYGPHFYSTGIPTINPPAFNPPYQDNPANGPIYASFVPKTDSDGNDIAGIPCRKFRCRSRLTLGARAGPQNSDGCEGSGQYPFPAKRRLASGDPRCRLKSGNVETYSLRLNAIMVRAIRLPVTRRYQGCADTG